LKTNKKFKLIITYTRSILLVRSHTEMQSLTEILDRFSWTRSDA